MMIAVAPKTDERAWPFQADEERWAAVLRRDGRADGYVYNGQYYQGTPSGYAPMTTPPPAAGERG